MLTLCATYIISEVPFSLLLLLGELCREDGLVGFSLLYLDIDGLLDELHLFHDDLLLLLLPLEEHGSEVHAPLHRNKEFEVTLCLAMAILDDALVVTLFLLPAFLHAQDDHIALGAIRIRLITGLHVQIFETLQ